MGYNRWTSTAHSMYAAKTGYLKSKSPQETFVNNSVSRILSPYKMKPRESCNSALNPKATPVIFGLDVTASMELYADKIAKTELPKLMTSIINSKVISDPHVMFMGIDDVRACQEHSLQVSQFEADIKIIEQMRELWLVKRGGGNKTESYDLAWYAGAYYTKLDCIKENRFGFLFTIGDEEAPYEDLTDKHVESIFGENVGEKNSYSSTDLLDLVRAKYQVFHILVEQGNYCSTPKTLSNARKSWTSLLGNNALFMKNIEQLSDIVTATFRIANGQPIAEVVKENPELYEYAFHNAMQGLEEPINED